MDEQQHSTPEHWTPADDEAVRGALDLLRRDVESLPLADVRFIKARGSARRRRAMVVGVASAAAAVVAIGFVASNTVGSNQGLDARPATPNTTVTSPTPTNSAAPVLVGGPLPVASEWKRALGITQSVVIVQARPGEGPFADCPVAAPGEPLETSVPKPENSGQDAVQAVYRAASPDAGNAAAAAAVSQLISCQSPGMTLKVEADAAWPKVVSTVTVPTTGEPPSRGWYVVAHQGALTSLIGVFESNATTAFYTVAQIQALALVAQQRLVREVEGASQPSVSTTRTDPGPATTQTAQ